ncbi:MAG TPA: hypothetical protein VLE72_00385 [Candidatus Saccharimonadales bacterium]|nr:hypothetical protein [Candidatus Saccharimonadales bacterium]
MKIGYKIWVAATCLIMLVVPAMALADDATTTPTDATPVAVSTDQTTAPVDSTTSPAPTTTDTTAPTIPTTTTTGPTTPTGPDANQYTFNPTTGLWESALYTWDPVTNQTSPKTDPGSYYNPSTGMWDTTTYQYHPETGTYQPVTTSTPVSPTSTSGNSGGVTSGGSPDLMSALAQLLGLPGDPSISGTGPNSNNSIVSTTHTNGFFDLFSRAAITNNLNSQASTGNASVNGNTAAGSATTGAATVISNLFNLLNSAWSWASGGLSSFVANLFGNQSGDVLIHPTTVTGGGGILGSLPGLIATNSSTGPNSANTITSGLGNDITVSAQSSGAIDNNLNLLATSGNADVSGNTSAGNATTGPASVDANILNLINSAIGAGQSFFGVVNIFGNLTGNILFPQGFLDSVAAANTAQSPTTSASNSGTGPNSLNQIDSTTNNNLAVTTGDQTAINNNINAGAQSGSAQVSNNTSAGSATTGNASTNTNVFNFAGQLASDNAVLVLVNVLGHWVGAILNLPQTGGSQAALLTGGATTLTNQNTGPNSLNQITDSSTNNLNLSSQNTSGINNNINAGAISGNASVTDNTRAGDATSGNANVAVDVANFVGSSLNINHWFGVLMINVFGDWFGSVSTATTSVAAVNTATIQANQTANSNSSKTGGSTAVGGGVNSNQAQVSQTASPAPRALAAAAKVLGTEQNSAAAKQNHRIMYLALISAFLMLSAGMLASLERKIGQ